MKTRALLILLSLLLTAAPHDSRAGGRAGSQYRDCSCSSTLEQTINGCKITTTTTFKMQVIKPASCESQNASLDGAPVYNPKADKEVDTSGKISCSSCASGEWTPVPGHPDGGYCRLPCNSGELERRNEQGIECVMLKDCEEYQSRYWHMGASYDSLQDCECAAFGHECAAI
jgi:hypothetical protein